MAESKTRYLAGLYIHTPNAFDDKSTWNIKGIHSPTLYERVGERNETSKTEEPETFCLEAAGTVEATELVFILSGF